MSGHNLDYEALEAIDGIREERIVGSQTVAPDRDNMIISQSTSGTVTVLGPQGPGQRLQIAQSDGNGPTTFNFPAGINAAGNTNVAFDTEGENASFLSIRKASAFVWKIVHNEGGTLS